MDQLEALDISDSNVALLFSERSLKGCYLPLKYDADGDAIDLSSDQQGDTIVFYKPAKTPII